MTKVIDNTDVDVFKQTVRGLLEQSWKIEGYSIGVDENFYHYSALLQKEEKYK